MMKMYRHLKRAGCVQRTDADGNYITMVICKGRSTGRNGKLAVLTTLGGDAAAVIKNKEVVITTKDQGTADYSVQLVQPKLPAKQGYTYEVTFDAYASADRAVGIAIKAPNRSYKAYLEDSVNVTTEKQTYTLTYKWMIQMMQTVVWNSIWGQRTPQQHCISAM